MITMTGTDKPLSAMTDDELAAIIADCTHTINRKRFSNEGHLHYLQARVESCRLELAIRR